jgi:DNA-nicking Smr family endonuclease
MRKSIWNRSNNPIGRAGRRWNASMPKQPVDANEEDGDVFQELFANVTPLRAHGRIIHPTARRKPIPEQHLRDERAALADSLSDHITWDIGTESGDQLVYLRNGLSPQTLRKLRRGHWVIQAELDLHGHITSEAREALVEFLKACRRDGARCVRIIHGKGLRSKNREPVLKTKVANWLIQRDEVLAFCQARQVDGGGGAVIVLLKTGSGQRA